MARKPPGAQRPRKPFAGQPARGSRSEAPSGERPRRPRPGPGFEDRPARQADGGGGEVPSPFGHKRKPHRKGSRPPHAEGGGGEVPSPFGHKHKHRHDGGSAEAGGHKRKPHRKGGGRHIEGGGGEVPSPFFRTEEEAPPKRPKGWAKNKPKTDVLRQAKKRAKPNAKRRADDEVPAPAAPPKPKMKARFGKYGTEQHQPREAAPTPALRPLPTKDELRAYLASAQGRAGKGDISRHFGLTLEQRDELRLLLASLKQEGPVTPAARQAARHPERLGEMAVVEVFGTDPDGDALARPVQWDSKLGRPPIVFMRAEKRGEVALVPGERVLARLRSLGGDKYEGRSFKRLGAEAPRRILGVFERGRITPTDRRVKGEWIVPPGAENGAREGEIVLAEPIPGHRPLGARPAQVVEKLGRLGEPKSVSLICIHAHGIPDAFPAEAVAEAEKAKATTVRGRDDLRKLPLVTIDGEDARDFDDAVHAAPDGKGWKVTVAIADVAHYVKPDSALDREAWARGNSVYFPDRVVPMLPEALSNGWCSLRPDENRGCLYVEMFIDAGGHKTGHRFGRGLMRSHARLTYEQAQQHADAGTEPEGLAPGHMAALYGAFRALLAARLKRGTLDLDIPERRVMIDETGKVTGVVPRPRLDSHRLIEEFMVLANVCAAEELEKLSQPCMYRVHAPPSDEKQEGLRQFLHGLDLKLPPKDQLHPRDFAALLEQVRGKPHERIVNETVLRSQSQAAYSPDNIGHFGLGLARYAHFTSPIRRYADLLVHRALIRGLKLGTSGALTEHEAARFPDSAEHITSTERRAAQAERDAVDRYLAAFMAERVGHVFDARISGVTRFGLFVTVEENGASGLVPLASLPDDKWTHDEASHRLAGRRTGLTFSLGEAVEARLAEATPRTGGLVFQLMQGDPRASSGFRKRPAKPSRR